MQSPRPVDQIDQSAGIKTHVVALHSTRSFWNRWHKGGDLLWRVRVGDIDDFQAAGKPRDWNFRTADFLTELVHSGVILLWSAVLFVDLETRKWSRPSFIRDIHQPEERG